MNVNIYCALGDQEEEEEEEEKTRGVRCNKTRPQRWAIFEYVGVHRAVLYARVEQSTQGVKILAKNERRSPTKDLINQPPPPHTQYKIENTHTHTHSLIKTTGELSSVSKGTVYI